MTLGDDAMFRMQPEKNVEQWSLIRLNDSLEKWFDCLKRIVCMGERREWDASGHILKKCHQSEID